MWRRPLLLLVTTLLVIALLGEAYAQTQQLSVSSIYRLFKWDYKSRQFTWEIKIPASYYLGYASISLNERMTLGFGNMVTFDDPIIRSLASNLLNKAKQMKFDEYDTANFILAFVQSLKYSLDGEMTPYKDYPKFPLETLVEGWADCEDSSLLYAALLKAAGYDALLIVTPGHMAVGVALSKSISGAYVTYAGKKYFYAETTNPGLPLGVAPPEVIHRSAELHIIPEKPKGLQLQTEKINELLNYSPERFKELENENSQLKQQNQRLLNQVSELEKEISSLKQEVSKLKSENLKLSKDNMDLVLKNMQLLSELELLTKENKELLTRVWNLHNEIADLAAENNQLKSDLKYLNLTLSKIKPKAEMMDALIGALPMLLGMGIAVLIGIAIAFYYLGRSAERKEILGI